MVACSDDGSGQTAATQDVGRDVDSERDVTTEPDVAADEPESNAAPTIEWADAPAGALVGMVRTVTAIASDPDGDEITLSWSAERGAVQGTGDRITYTAPSVAGDDVVTVVADDGNDHVVELELTLTIADPLDFSVPAVIVETPGNAKTPDIVVMADGTIHVLWHDFTTDPPGLNHAVNRGENWSWTPLQLVSEKSIFVELVSDGENLHMLWQADRPETTIMHASYAEGGWSAAAIVGLGEKVTAALDPDGVLHAVFYRDERPAHAVLREGVWRAGNDIPITEPFVNTFGMALVGHDNGIDLAVPTSPGDARYDVHIVSWRESQNWSTVRTIYESFGLSSDEPDGAMGQARAHWVWTEQDEDNPSLIAIVEKTEADLVPRIVSDGPGFSTAPSIAIPQDGQPLVAYVTADDRIEVSRAPYSERIDFGGDFGAGPAITVDSLGFSYVVYYARDEGGIQQVYFSTNRPGVGGEAASDEGDSAGDD